MRTSGVIIILLILAIGIVFYISLQKDTEVLVVEVTLARPPDNDSAKIISYVNASFSNVRRMEVPEETPLLSPGITVLVIQNMQEMSGWYSVPIPKSGGIYGAYNLTLKLSKNFDRNQSFRLLTRVVDPAGRDVSVKATDLKLS